MFKEVVQLADVRRLAARRAWREANWARMAVAAAFIVVGVVIAAGVFLLFRAFFVEIAGATEGPAPLIVKYVLEASFATVLFLGVASFVASSIPLIYANGEVRLLAALPVEPSALFMHRFLLAASLSVWPVLVVGVPALAALGVAVHAPAPYYAFAAVALLLLSLTVALTGGLLSFVFAWLAALLPRSWLRLADGVLFVAMLFLFMRQIVPHALYRIFDVNGAAAIEASSQRLDAIFGWFPTHPLAQATLAFTQPSGQPAALAWNALAIAVALVLMTLFAGRWYIALRQRFEEISFVAGYRGADGAAKQPPFPRLWRLGHGYIFEKEWLNFTRNPDQLARAGFLMLLLFFCLFALRAVAKLGGLDEPVMQSKAVAASFAAIGYFALALGLRFAFPALSQDGRCAWVIWSSPMHRHELFSWKYFFWCAVIAVPIIGAALVTIRLFGVPWPLAIGFLTAAACTVAAMVVVTLGQGCLYPDFRDRDPDELSTSPAGLAATAIGVGYVWVVTRYVRMMTLAYLMDGRFDAVALFGLLVVTVGIVAAYWVIASRALEHAEAGRA
ncbi:MAG: hypothetical protein PHT12_00255 [Patescibacteria group bacterium]|nr:hypothetical protein [Patescibacteria group bacterium]